MAKKGSIKNTGVSKVKNAIRSNGLSDAIMGFTPGGIGTPLTQLDTLFKNNRWYLVSNMRQVESEAYVEHGIIQTIVDVPVDDAFRGGVDILSKQLSAEQIEELSTYIDRENILMGAIGQAKKWERLFGGAGVVILTDQDPATPLDLNAIQPDTPVDFRACDMWELYWDLQNSQGFDPTLQQQKSEFYSFYGIKLHHSRVIKMPGKQAPSFVQPRLRGWGTSVMEVLINSLNQYLKSNNLAFEVLDEFKLDIYKIKGFSETMLSGDGTAMVQKRIQLANLQKNYLNSLSMDADDDYIQKQLSFTGLADMMKEIRIQIACDLRMPLTKIFGLSASGFNSGEDDIEVYNGMVEGQVRSRAKYDILRVLEVCCQKLFGMIPDDLNVEFQPLRILSSVDEETVKTQQFTRLLQAAEAGRISAKQFQDACNKENLLGIQLDAESLSTALEADARADLAETPPPGEAEKQEVE